MATNALPISRFTVTSALGAGSAAHVEALLARRTGLRKLSFARSALDCWLGEIAGMDKPLPHAWRKWECRNNRLAEFALSQDGFDADVAGCRERYGAERIGIFLGTSTSGIHHTELAYRERASDGALPDWLDFRTTQNIFSITDFVAQRLGVAGPSLAISTACSSSAKVFAAAYRSIATGQCDAAIVGGVDSLCLTTLYGFNSLQLLSSEMCRPADIARNGISIGEAAGFALLDPGAESAFSLLGYGESSDAYHMSSPEPNGAGAAASMRAALGMAQVNPADVDYVNLHGTGTLANDLAECRAIVSVFGTTTPCSSTKGWTGHTLGAAGIVEAVLSLCCLQQELLPASLNTRQKDPNIEANIILENQRRTSRRILSNSFGFGGSNCSLLFGRES